MIENLKSLTPTATKIFEAVYKYAKEQDGYFTTGDFDPEDVYEPFSFEIQEGVTIEDTIAKIVVVSQHWICNGDLMSDPCMRFLYAPNTHKVYPLDFQQDGVPNVGTDYEVCMQINNNAINRLDESLEHELAEFASIWLMNVYTQHHEIEALAPELKQKVIKNLQ